jgi:glycosyltransferase involved in cell wall biosynthesis
MARVAIVTDGWHPQINGAVTTLSNTVAALARLGHEVEIIEPSRFQTRPCPTYPEIPLAKTTVEEMRQHIARARPDHVLVAVEGPLGLAARRALNDDGLKYSTAMFTRFQDYLWKRFAIPRTISLRWLDWFHSPSATVLVPTSAMQQFLTARGLRQARTWLPGVDSQVFQRRSGPATQLLVGLPRPLLLYVGRMAVEKNITAFLELQVRGTKVLVGDGPLLPRLRRRYPQAVYLGYRNAVEIAEICSDADVMVFPSRTDTFGHTMVEALSCGLPVAAYPERGPLDVLAPGIGAMNKDLAAAIDAALTCDREACAAYASRRFCWDKSARQLMGHLVPVRGV